ncbi:hypothetical protein DPMN_060495 [Dreissena polymorpha]|uniref:Uncharacterized protein n=1 Tax=Dreissena polymorpha TaxID=45954 RepID=A0A9D4C5P7_DREPO|nr:hypothetical protein DPMN_060495 [Dreissena polymorpha]
MKCAALRVKLDPKHTLHSTMHLFDIDVTSAIVSNMYNSSKCVLRFETDNPGSGAYGHYGTAVSSVKL